MKRVFLTGMSGTGKSSVISELAVRGYKAIDTDYGGWSEVVKVPRSAGPTGLGEGKDWLWREDRIARLLATEDADVLFISGGASNQGKFYAQFDHNVLLTAPIELMKERLTSRTNNPYGKNSDELARVLALKETVEPLLRRVADVEIDTSAPLEQVVERLLSVVFATESRPLSSGTAYICVTCGVQQAPSVSTPERCPICEDERQYVRQGGQAWMTLERLAAQGHRVELRELEPGLTGVGAEPAVGIGQRSLLVRTPAGNFLWDCFGYIDAKGVEAIRRVGGLAGIAFSHPHFYGAMVEWSLAFDGCPIWIPSDDRMWVQRESPAIVEWRGTREVLPGITLVQTGGHFDGSAVLHWAAGADGRAPCSWATRLRSCRTCGR